jgi:CBS domain-containing protein
VGILGVRALPSLDPERWPATRVREVMRRIGDHDVVAPDDPVSHALRQASRNGLSRVAVVDHGRLVGYLSVSDITHVLALHGIDLKRLGGGHTRRATPRPTLRRAA